ncbi:unnamed protein product, partial [Brenthis ino]
MSSNKKTSVVWDHFTDIGGSRGVCNICKVQMSYKSSVSNLKKHLQRKHPTICVVSRTDAVAGDSSAVNDVCIASVASGGGNTNVAEAINAGTNTIPNPVANDKVMQLFTLDFQPFRIVEDRGFRELMQLAFPNYIIPTRKYFANNLLPSLYEKKKSELRISLENDVKSICITVDIWSTMTNDSMMAITGHYISETTSELKYCLLDCIPLEESHSAKNLARLIKEICDEWNLSNKVLLAVTDNGSNIKNAIEKELAWKHFPCYSHTLNLIVNDALKSEDITLIINKVKIIVKQFKQSNLAWQKLKKYQEQAGNTPKRLIQEVATRWNSKYYMLQRCVELREPLNSAMINLSMDILTSYEWQVCTELCKILQPCEEVTKELSGEKYLTGSLVIPITTGLTKVLQNYENENLMPIVDRVRQDLLGGIGNRFNNLTQSRTFTNCMFLDPRFKFYFNDQATALETKRRITAFVIQEQSRQNNATIEMSNPQASTSTSTKLIRQDYREKMRNIQPEGTAHSRAIVEIQRYLDAPIIDRSECPLKWWKIHRESYPNLYKVAVQKLNAMASSVPCERVFSAAGNMLNERRTRLGIRKLQQLVFLNQNI